MATVSRTPSGSEVTITLSADAAEALMPAIVVLTHATNEAINDEFDEVWNGLADEFAAEAPYTSKRFAFKQDETLVYDL